MINVQKHKITFAQSLIIFWAVGLLIGTVLVVHLIYGPAQRRLVEIEEKVAYVEAHLKWLDEVIEGINNPDQVMAFFVNAKQALGRKFPETEQRSLAMIADYANKFRVQLTRITAEPSQVLKNARGKALEADQKTCRYVYVALTLKSDYLNLVKYIEALYKVLPAYMTVERLEIEDGAPAVPRLETNLELALYLLER